jgi:uncharacterized protein with HEPN domain
LPFRDTELLLRDILESIALIESYVRDMEFADYLSSISTQDSVERRLSIISEAAKRLGPAAASLCPEIDWGDVRGMGNWLRHGYEMVNDNTIWDTITVDLPPPLKACVGRALAKPAENSG